MTHKIDKWWENPNLVYLNLELCIESENAKTWRHNDGTYADIDMAFKFADRFTKFIKYSFKDNTVKWIGDE